MNVRRLASLILSSCVSLSAAAAGIEGPTWTATSVRGLEKGLLPSGAGAITVTFQDGRVGGFSGCNRFSGTYVLQSGGLLISHLAASLSECYDGSMKIEEAFIHTLEGMFRPILKGDHLTLLSKQGTPVLQFKAQSVSPKRMSRVESEVR